MRLGTKVWSNSRIQFASNESKLVPRKLDPGLKWALVCLQSSQLHFRARQRCNHLSGEHYGW
jgi:hypothetical protein